MLWNSSGSSGGGRLQRGRWWVLHGFRERGRRAAGVIGASAVDFW